MEFLSSFKSFHLKITYEVLLIDGKSHILANSLGEAMDENDEDVDVERRRQILEKALEIILDKFPTESEIELIDGKSGLAVVKEKLKQPEN